MPIFEYICGKCGHQFEQLVFRAAESINCPACDSDSVSKLVSTFASNAFEGKGSHCSSGNCIKKHNFG
ncbi:MAG: zinc ribbon domain-containing protein [candidate division Zixibacteria bacterium]|nr:zinc ribbon domain-containing protein [candidate division Zixibacteria bacterium]